MRCCFRGRRLAGLVVWLSGAIGVGSAAPPAESRLVVELERIYAGWKSAMASRDLTGWARHTARARQMAVRNTIVSQKREWPRALFSLALTPPEVDGFPLAGSEALGSQARLIYQGRVDFRLGDPRLPPAAAFVLDFVREPSGWKFFGGRYYNLQNDTGLARQLASGDFSGLGGPLNVLNGQPPPVPPPCPLPDYAGQIRVASVGYVTAVELGEFHRDSISDRTSNEIIIGGLKRGITPLKLSVQATGGSSTGDRSLEISVYAITPHLKTPAVRVFHFQPNNPVGETYSLTINVGAATLREGNEIDLIPAAQ